jgi:SAM-dependent methyltransferase
VTDDTGLAGPLERGPLHAPEPRSLMDLPEYRGLMAATWDLLRGDTSDWPDRHFYLGLIRRAGEPVLDVGCATGRLLLDFLAQGIDIDGVDLAPEMLDLCRRRARERDLEPALYLQAMESLDLPRRYRTILVPSSSFQLLLSPDAAERAMDRFHAHLLPEGTLVMPFIVLDTPAAREGETWVHEAVRPEDGAVVRRTSYARYDPGTRHERTRDVYEVLRDGEVVEREAHERDPATRAYTVEEAVGLYERHGFRVTRIAGSFGDEAYQPGRDRVFTVEGVRQG